MKTNNINPGEIYEHYKGLLYRIITLGYIEGTKEEAVVYQSISSGIVWIRPLVNFTEEVVIGFDVEVWINIEDPAIKIKVPRFKKVN